MDPQFDDDDDDDDSEGAGGRRELKLENDDSFSFPPPKGEEDDGLQLPAIDAIRDFCMACWRPPRRRNFPLLAIGVDGSGAEEPPHCKLNPTDSSWDSFDLFEDKEEWLPFSLETLSAPMLRRLIYLFVMELVQLLVLL